MTWFQYLAVRARVGKKDIAFMFFQLSSKLGNESSAAPPLAAPTLPHATWIVMTLRWIVMHGRVEDSLLRMLGGECSG